ncbi:MAG: tRNA (N6-isopentenyl adenosine(37)-C2)-methylthiotransferase MiaB [Candidatus Omnitrophica bacterium]|nr:tRNA (N6-isopentenyl adenosine(37)-C2)-methylthiotransferase MiaB [Candidatus Omnitrophota bacterium]
MKSKVCIRTFGCQMNVRDSEVIAGLAQANGYQLVDDEAKADIVIFNTCSVRQHAEEKVWSAVGRCQANIIGIVGCMANNYREAIFEKSPKVDFVVGTADTAKIPRILKEIEKHKKSPFEKKIYETDADFRDDEIYHTGFHLDREHAFVVITEGCQNFCSYCVVPYVRGKLRSRRSEDIIKEIKQDLDSGIKKITLLGQNVNAYSDGAVDFIKLIALVNDIKGLREFSFVTSHPKDTSEALFKAMANAERLKKYLHLPVQSGADVILKRMNRGYTRKYYLDLVEKYRTIVSNGALTTDIIVGFPGETMDDFEDTRRLVELVAFNAAFIFKYSPRPHTQAASLQDDVPRLEKEKRHRIILELQKDISKRMHSQPEAQEWCNE